MQKLSKIGMVEFNKPYTKTNVLLYLISILLKAHLVDSKTLSNYLDLSIKQTQRYMYNSFTKPTINSNLEDISLILEYMNLSLSEIFIYVDLFINNNGKLATYNVNNKSLKIYNYIFKESSYEIKTLLNERKQLINNYGSEYMKPYSDHFLSKLIESTSKVIEKCSLELKENNYV